MDALDSRDEAEAYDRYHWHIEYFRRLRFKRYQAEILEQAGVEPHDVEDLIARGCPRDVQLIVEILS